MSASAKRPPVVAIGAVAVTVTAIVYFVFLRGGSESHAAKADAVPTASPRTEAPTPAPPPRDTALQTVGELCDAGKWIEARAAIARVFASELPDAMRSEFSALALKIQEKILAAGSPDIESYEIQAGDSLSKIAGRFKNLKGCYGPVLILNDLKDPAATLRLGRRLRIPKGAWTVVADKSLFALWLCYEGAPIRSFRVAIGREEKTPAGVFAVGNKNPKPAWYPPHELLPELKKEGVPIPIPYGHPRNPLGEYWVALDHKDHQGLGIHGTNDPASIGTRASNGCVRMNNKEVLLVAWTVAPGTAVTIVE